LYHSRRELRKPCRLRPSVIYESAASVNDEMKP